MLECRLYRRLCFLFYILFGQDWPCPNKLRTNLNAYKLPCWNTRANPCVECWNAVHRSSVDILKKTINSPWNNREAVREMSIHISMWLCYYNIEGKLFAPEHTYFNFFFFLHILLYLRGVQLRGSWLHSPGWPFRCPLMGTSETSLSSHTSSRSCPCSQFAHSREWEGGRVDWENRTICLC